MTHMSLPEVPKQPTPVAPTRSPSLLLVSLLLVLAIVLVLPFWLVRFPPLFDYPNHLASVFVLSHLHDPNFQFDRYYTTAWQVKPYVVFELTMLGLEKLVGIMAAGKVVLSMCVIGLPLAAWFFLSSLDPKQGSMALWSLLFVYNPFLLMGFMSFVLSISLCFVVVGLWLRFARAPTLGRWIGLLLLATLLYLVHLGGFVLAGFIVCAYAVLTRSRWPELATAVGIFVPGVLMNLKFSSKAAHWSMFWGTWHEKLAGLPTPLLGQSYLLDEALLATTLIAALTLVIANSELKIRWQWLAILGALLAMYVAVPRELGPVSETDRRFLPFVFIVALATVVPGRRMRKLLPVVLLLFGVHWAYTTVTFLRAQTRLEAFERSFDVLPRDCRFLPLLRLDPGRFIQNSQQHFWSYGVIERGCFSPSLFTVPEIHPLRIRGSHYVPRESHDGYVTPLNWAAVQKDYDYVWAYNVPAFASDLNKVGDAVYQYGELTVYRLHRGSSESAPQ